MHDSSLRAELAENLGALLDGDISNDEFDNFLADEGCLGCSDRAVDEIAWWAWTLYSDTHEHHLTGRNLLDEETYQAGARAILFLQSELPYAWPSLQEPYSVFLLRALEHNWWLPTTGCLLLSLYNYGFQAGGITVGPLLLLATTFLAIGCRSAGRLADSLMSQPTKAFDAAGNVSCWPFLNQSQLQAAQRSQGRYLR